MSTATFPASSRSAATAFELISGNAGSMRLRSSRQVLTRQRISSNLVQPYSERLLEDLDGITPSFDHWLAAERTRFEDRVRKILEAELDRLIEQNARPEVRAAAARRLINFEPTHEGAARNLMRAFAQMGDRAQAIREFERCRQALLTVLDLPPSKETTAVYEAIRIESPPGVAPVIRLELVPIRAMPRRLAARLAFPPAGRSSGKTTRSVLPLRPLARGAARTFDRGAAVSQPHRRSGA